jgi:hypothetical protein
MRIRAATDHDAQAIGHVHVEVWRFAYRDILPEAYLASLSPEERAGQWRSLLKDPGSTRFVLVVVNERGDVVGFAAAGPQRSDESEYQGELYALYVLPLQHWWCDLHRGCVWLATAGCIPQQICGGHVAAVGILSLTVCRVPPDAQPRERMCGSQAGEPIPG